MVDLVNEYPGKFVMHDGTKYIKLYTKFLFFFFHQIPGEVSIVSLGSTTNIALAASLGSNFMENVKQIYVMGSSVNSLVKEYNFGLDPESNAIFLNSTKYPKTYMITKYVYTKNKFDKVNFYCNVII